MFILFILINISFLCLLFYYQKNEKIYVGYTTVLGLLFGALLAISVATLIINGRNCPFRLFMYFLLLLNGIAGAVLIYVTSQLTLAFEKIRQLAQHIALREAGEEKEGDE